MVIEINTSRFGPVTVDSEDLLQFPAGLLGMEECRQWVLLGDAQNSAVAWLQSVDKPRMALAVVSPRRFVPDYRIRIARAEIEPLGLAATNSAEVLVIVGRNERGVTLNLKAPLLINLETRRGRQVVTNGNLPVRYELKAGQIALKKSA